MMQTVDPQAATDTVVRAVARLSQNVGIFAESSSPMFYGTRALCNLEDAPRPYYQLSVHHGSMGHAIGGAIGFCIATGQRAVLLTGDGSLHLMNPLPTALKHGCALTVVCLNDSRLGLPYFGSALVGAPEAQKTTQLPSWDFTRTGSPLVGGRRVSEIAALEGVLAEALSFQGCFVVDVLIDPTVVPPVGARFESVREMFAGKGS